MTLASQGVILPQRLCLKVCLCLDVIIVRLRRADGSGFSIFSTCNAKVCTTMRLNSESVMLDYLLLGTIYVLTFSILHLTSIFSFVSRIRIHTSVAEGARSAERVRAKSIPTKHVPCG